MGEARGADGYSPSVADAVPIFFIVLLVHETIGRQHGKTFSHGAAASTRAELAFFTGSSFLDLIFISTGVIPG